MARRKAAYRKRHQNRFSIASLGAQIEAEQTRAEQIEEFGKYTQTKAYVEEVAKDKLGLVYEGEILFQEDD